MLRQVYTVARPNGRAADCLSEDCEFESRRHRFLMENV